MHTFTKKEFFYFADWPVKPKERKWQWFPWSGDVSHRFWCSTRWLHTFFDYTRRNAGPFHCHFNENEVLKKCRLIRPHRPVSLHGMHSHQGLSSISFTSATLVTYKVESWHHFDFALSIKIKRTFVGDGLYRYNLQRRHRQHLLSTVQRPFLATLDI